jgi:23S rRNA (pseudouridine1915-N3)-methyltransferase
MRLTIVCMGKTKEAFIRDGIAKYVRYLKPYADIEVKELREEKIDDLREAPRIRKKEAEKILKTTPPGAVVIALDERGKEFSSHEFASFLNQTIESGARELVFIVGGAMGLDEGVTGRAHTVLALSRWTLTHEMARIVLLEQIYRAFTIIRGKTYHY